MPGFPLRPGVWIGEGAEIHPSAEVVGPALIGDNCRIGAGRRASRSLRARFERARRRQHRPRAVRHSRQRLPRPVRERPGLCHRPLVRRPTGRPSRGRRRARRGVESRAPGRRRGRREGVPAQDHRGGRRRELLDHLGVPRVEEPVRPSRRGRHRQRGPLARGGAPRRDGVRDDAPERRHGDRVARLQPGGADAEACGHGRHHRRRVQRRGPGGGDRARDAVPDPYRDDVRRDHGPVGAGGSAVGGASFLECGRRGPRRGRPTQDRTPLRPGGVAPGAGRRDRRHRLCVEDPRALHQRARRPRGPRRHPDESVSSSFSTTPSVRPASSCRTCSRSSGADVLGDQPATSRPRAS